MYCTYNTSSYLATVEFLLYINSQLTTVFKMTFICISARMDTIDPGLSHPFTVPGQ